MKKVSTRNKLLKVTAIVAAAEVALAALTIVVGYPTARHVEVAQSIAAQNPNEVSLSAVLNTPEAAWTAYSGIAISLLTTVAFIFGVYFVYRYLRQRRIVAKPHTATVGIFAIGSLFAVFSNQLMGMLYNVPAMSNTLAGFVGYAVANLVVSVIFTIIVVLVSKSIYDKRHGFEIS